jgi:predicted O-methyltransferase YrrM
MRFVFRERPVPLALVLRARRLCGVRDAFYPTYRSTVTSGRVLRDQHLVSALADKELGEWSLTAAAVNFLDGYLRYHRPRCVLEFGSGLSTVCLAHILRESAEDARLIAIDESDQFLGETREMLEALALSDCVELHVRPLLVRTIDDETIQTYDLDDALLSSITEPTPPDLVLIDGPSGGRMGRFGALRLLLPYLRFGTTVMLDDALRDEELTVARRWRDAGILEIDGIHMLGKGLLVGHVLPVAR